MQMYKVKNNLEHIERSSLRNNNRLDRETYDILFQLDRISS